MVGKPLWEVLFLMPTIFWNGNEIQTYVPSNRTYAILVISIFFDRGLTITLNSYIDFESLTNRFKGMTSSDRYRASDE